MVSAAKATDTPETATHKEYKYTQEISQMMYVFGEVQNPNPETAHLVEDIVRSQLVELIMQAHALATRRGARHPSTEDLMFLIRHDRAKVNRLRTYLSWKDVRKHAKEQDAKEQDAKDQDAGEEENPEDTGDDKIATKAQKITIKLPWEIKTMFSDVLPADDEEDDDDIEAHEASVERLKEADDVTRQMTREEYQHYTDCRQASFTYRKPKRFREFLNLPSAFDLKSGDDIFDIVGFLAFEMVRSLTVGGLKVKKSLEDAYPYPQHPGASHVPGKRKAHGLTSLAKRMRCEERESLEDDADQPPPACALFLPPSGPRTALRPEHIQDAFARMQGDWTQRRSAGMRNFRGGLIRTTVSLI